MAKNQKLVRGLKKKIKKYKEKVALLKEENVVKDEELYAIKRKIRVLRDERVELDTLTGMAKKKKKKLIKKIAQQEEILDELVKRKIWFKGMNGFLNLEELSDSVITYIEGVFKIAQYEYKRIDFNKATENYLNKLGKEGWSVAWYELDTYLKIMGKKDDPDKYGVMMQRIKPESLTKKLKKKSKNSSL